LPGSAYLVHIETGAGHARRASASVSKHPGKRLPNVRFWHKADIPLRSTNVRYGGKADVAPTWDDVCFSNRPGGVKRFQTIHDCGIDVTRGLVLLYGIGT